MNYENSCINCSGEHGSPIVSRVTSKRLT